MSREATTGHLRCHDVEVETREIFNTYMALAEALENPSGYTRDKSFDLGLDFSTEIESDSIGPSSNGSQENTSSSGSVADSEKYKEFGLILQRIGDDINEEFVKKNAAVQEALQNLGEKLIKDAAENVFQETMEGILTEFTGSFPQRDEKYKVALVMLCARSSVIAINSALDATKETRDSLVGTATSFIAGHFPRWIENFSK